MVTKCISARNSSTSLMQNNIMQEIVHVVGVGRSDFNGLG